MSTPSRERMAKKLIRGNKSKKNRYRRRKLESGWDACTVLPSIEAFDAVDQSAGMLKPVGLPSLGKGMYRKKELRAPKLAPIPSAANEIKILGEGSSKKHLDSAEKLYYAAVEAIKRREALIYRLNAVILSFPSNEFGNNPDRTNLAHVPETNHRGDKGALLQIAKSLQQSGICCVEAIARWMLYVGANSEEPPQFLWHEENYLVKMYRDLDFAVEACQSVGIKGAFPFGKSNPLLIAPDQQVGRVWAAHLIIIDVAQRESSTNSINGVGALDPAGDTSLDMILGNQEVEGEGDQEATVLDNQKDDTVNETSWRLPEEIIALMTSVEERELLSEFIVHLQACSIDFEGKNPGEFENMISLWSSISAIGNDKLVLFLDEICFLNPDSVPSLMYMASVEVIDQLLNPFVVAVREAIKDSAAESPLGDMGINQIFDLFDEAKLDNHASVKFSKRKEILSTANKAAKFLQSKVASTFSHSSRSINSILEIFTPFILSDATTPQSGKLKNTLRDIERCTGLFCLSESGYLMNESSKRLILSIELLKNGSIEKLNIVCSREDSVSDSIGKIFDSLTTHRQEKRPFICQFFPFFKCEYGKKVVSGQKVDEAEGHGPRKEWFSLLSKQFCVFWRPQKGHLEIVVNGIQMHSSGGCSVSASSIGKHAIAGHQISQNSNDKVCFKVKKVIDDDTIILQSTYQEVQQAFGSDSVDLQVQVPNTPILTYIQDSESYWISDHAPDTKAVRSELKLLGILIGSTIVNQTTLDLNINPLLFKYLIESYSDVVDIDELETNMSFVDNSLLESIKKTKSLSPKQFSELLAAEELLNDRDIKTWDDYYRYTLSNHLLQHSNWRIDEIKAGMQSVISVDTIKSMYVTFNDLQKIVCGSFSRNGFFIRDVFVVSMDTEFTECQTLMNTFWKIVDSFDENEKRLLIQFVTGVAQLPLLKSEFFRIEMPYTAIKKSEYNSMFQRLPQAHTCDNILELPNYYEAWRSVKNIEGDNLSKKEQSDFTEFMRNKILTAISNNHGYGLDGGMDTTVTETKVSEEEMPSQNTDEDDSQSEDFLDIPSIEESERSSPREQLKFGSEEVEHVVSPELGSKESSEDEYSEDGFDGYSDNDFEDD